jgi:type IV secretory pathway TrbL component
MNLFNTPFGVSKWATFLVIMFTEVVISYNLKVLYVN